jgi:hypothetical protein
MRPEYLFAILLTGAGTASANAVNAAADYFPWLHSHPGLNLSLSIAATILFMCCAIFFAVRGKLKAEHEGTSTSRMTFGIITAPILIVSGVAAWYRWPVAVYSDFREVYVAKSQELGAPIRTAVNGQAAYEVWLQHAYVIWLPNPGIMCGFDTAGIRKPPTCTFDAFHSFTLEPDLWSETYVKGKLRLGRQDYWPRGSIAYYLINQPNVWGWMGKDLRQCTLDKDAVHFQDFEKGKIYGVFRATANANDLNTGIVFVVLNDGNWSRETVSVEAPKIGKCDGD